MAAGPRVTRRDLKEDKVYVTLAGVAGLFVRYRLWIALGAFALLLAFAGGYYRHLHTRRVAAEASWALYEATYSKATSDNAAALEKVATEYEGTPSARFASFKLANALYEDGRYEEALEAFRKFLKKNPDHLLAPSAMEAIGYCHESLGQWEEAIDTYQMLIRNRAASPVARRVNYRIGLCYENIEEKEKAIEAYERTVELLPDSLWAEYSNERLALLKPSAFAADEALPGPIR